MVRVSCLLLIALPCVLLACSGSKSRRPLPGANCVRNSDCQNPLSCSFGRCHEECRMARDCPDDQMCVVGDNERNVCLLPDEETCALDSSCPAPLVCAQDLKCRNECFDARDCATDTQVCVETEPDAMVCAEPDDLVDGALPLLPEDGGTQTGEPSDASADTGGAGSAGMGGTGGSAGGDGGNDPSDGGSAMDASPDAGDASDVDAGTDEGAAGEPDDDPPLPSIEVEPNDTREDANAYRVGDAVEATIAAAADIDYYELVVPADASAGGYFQGMVTEIDGGTISVVIYDASTHAQIAMATNITIGASVFFYWAAAAGEVYHLRVQRQPTGAEAFPYTFTVDFTAIDDPFEPNQTRDEPQPLALSETASAYLFAGFSDQNIVQTDYHDWYVIEEELAAGTLTVEITDVPTNVTANVRLYDAGNVLRDSQSGSLGSNVDASFSITTPGVYRLMVEPLTGPNTAGSGLTLPDHFTRAYQLTATQ